MKLAIHKMKAIIPPLILFLILLFPAEINAQFNFITTNGTITIIGCTNTVRSIIIPDKINGCIVTSIGDRAFANCVNLTNLTICQNITSIGSSAFDHCSSLKQIELPRKIEVLPEWPFSFCSRLTNISVAKENPFFSAVNGVLFNHDQSMLIQYPTGRIGKYSIPEGVRFIGGLAFYGCYGLTDLSVPGSITNIGNRALGYSRLTNITLHAGIVSIGTNAFDCCQKLSAVNLPETITDIGPGAFKNCFALQKISIPASVTNIGYFAFEGCTGLEFISVAPENPCFRSVDGVLFNRSLTMLIQCPQERTAGFVIPDGVTSIAPFALSGSKINNLFLPNSITDIGYAAFFGCKGITNLILPTGISRIPRGAFHASWNLQSVHLPSSVTNIGEKAFNQCTHLNSINLPEGITSIGPQAFGFCNLPEVIIPDSVTTIGSFAFSFCPNLTNVVVGKNLRTIGDLAFTGCKQLKAVYFLGNAPQPGSSPFDDMDKTTVYYLSGATGWGSKYSRMPTALTKTPPPIPLEH